MKAIINAELVMRDHLIPDAVVLMEDELIVAFGEADKISIPDDAEIIDADGYYVGPGLVDIHSHTGGDYQAWEHPLEAALYHLEHGVTTYLPTTYPRSSASQCIRACENVRAAMSTVDGKCIGGIHFEGPYINVKYGSNRSLNPWDKPVMAEDYEPILDASEGILRLTGFAPEREGILGYVKYAINKNPRVKFAVAHSEASPSEIERYIPYGLCIGTHHTNATGTLEKYPECRGVCVDEAVNYNSSIYAEIISDSKGIHVDPYMQRLVRRIKGDDRIILISDRTYSDAPPPDGYEGVHDINFDCEGEIAGSKLTLDVAAGNYMKHTGASLVDAFKVASYNPARALGFYDRGEINIGFRADLIFVDHRMNVKSVILCGNKIK